MPITCALHRVCTLPLPGEAIHHDDGRRLLKAEQPPQQQFEASPEGWVRWVNGGWEGGVTHSVQRVSLQSDDQLFFRERGGGLPAFVVLDSPG